jgi:signal transduction histidine kinase
MRADATRLTEELAEANRRLAAAQSDAVRTKSLKAIVAMAAGAAHELNNPLAVISGRAQLLRSQATTDDLRTQLDAIARQAQAASDVVTELLEFAQPRLAHPQQIRIQEVLARLRNELSAGGLLAPDRLVLDVPSDTPAVWFDPDILARVFRELFDNAIEATPPEDRRLTVKARPDLSEDFLVVHVTDNGRGMTPDVLGRAMDPFFSHRPAGRGRGLGLARVARCLAEGAGAISIESSPGHGTRVELRLPTRPSSDR